MLAVRLDTPGEPLRTVEVELPAPRGTEVRIRVAACGVCRTDLHLADGTQSRISLPRTLGHEVAGRVDASGPGAAEALDAAGLGPGDPVLVYGGWGCGTCRECRAGATQRCAESVAPGFQADGGYAEAMLVPDATVLEPLAGLDPLGAAPLADAGVTAYRAVTRAERWLRPGARVALIGCGGVGQLVLQLLRRDERHRGVLIVVADPRPARRTRAEQLGADAALPAAEPRDMIAALGDRADVVVDVVGTDATLRDAAALVAPDGLVVLVGEAGGTLPFGFAAPSLEAWLTTVTWGSRDDLRAVVRLARSGILEPIVEPMPLVEASRALARLRDGSVDGRIVLVP